MAFKRFEVEKAKSNITLSPKGWLYFPGRYAKDKNLLEIGRYDLYYDKDTRRLALDLTVGVRGERKFSPRGGKGGVVGWEGVFVRENPEFVGAYCMMPDQNGMMILKKIEEGEEESGERKR